MYDQHHPLIAQAAQRDIDTFADVGLLCILSARMPFERVAGDFATVGGLPRARLASLDVSGPVPWEDIGIDPDDGWNDVTIRELLDHRSGLSKARSSWFTGEGSCREYVPSLLA